MSVFLVQWNVERIEIIVSAIIHKKYLKLKEDYAKKTSEATGIKIKIQHWGRNRKLSMEGIAAEYSPNSVDNGNNEEKYEFHSYISDDNEQDACDSHAHMINRLIIFRIRNISVWYINSMIRQRWLCK